MVEEKEKNKSYGDLHQTILVAGGIATTDAKNEVPKTVLVWMLINEIVSKMNETTNQILKPLGFSQSKIRTVFELCTEVSNDLVGRVEMEVLLTRKECLKKD